MDIAAQRLLSTITGLIHVARWLFGVGKRDILICLDI